MSFKCFIFASMKTYILYNAANQLEMREQEMSHGDAILYNTDLRSAGSQCRWIVKK